MSSLHDLEDALEIQYLRSLSEETIPWEQVKAELSLDLENDEDLVALREAINEEQGEPTISHEELKASPG